MEWTDERIATLRKMWLEGMSASQVARQLGGVSRNAVIGKVHRMGLAGREAPSRPRSLGGRPPGRSAARVANSLPVRPASPPREPRAPAPAPVTFEVRPSATILTLGEHACRWPIGDPEETGFGFCGARRTGHASYCEGHANLSLRKKTKSADVGAQRQWLGRSPALPGQAASRSFGL
jgi:GcrA cell cycle regulator